MPSATPTATAAAQVVNPWTKFLVATVASISGLMLPPLAAFAQRYDSTGLSWRYILVSLVISALVGALVVFKTWGEAQRPWDIAMTALGLPAVLAGALAGQSSAKEINKLAAVQDIMARQLSQVAGIPVNTTAPAGDRGSSLFSPVVATVYAADAHSVDQAGVLVSDPQFWVVFRKEATRQSADQAMSGLKPRFEQTEPGKPPVKLEVVTYQGSFLVVEAGGGRKRDVALTRALELKRTYNLPVELQEIPKP